MHLPPLYPLLLERRLEQRIWGGERLASLLGLASPPGARFAESWQVFDENRVLNGPLATWTLAEVTLRYEQRLVGERSFAQYGADFPLLAKFLDAAESLSVQVHPDDAYAHEHEATTKFHGKTEAWYILEAKPGANIIWGLKEPLSREEFAAAIADERIVEILNRIPVQAGDVIFVPAGMVHALEPGITVFEIQQKSDLTYRIYDYGRLDASGQPRTLHLEKALDVSDLSGNLPPPPLPLPLDKNGSQMLLVACSSFALERLMCTAPLRTTTDFGSCEILTIIAGQGWISWAGGRLPLAIGQSLVLPAALGNYTLLPSQPMNILRCTIPDLNALEQTLRTRDLSEECIARTVLQSANPAYTRSA